jgi:FtsP/CotA-like multicopper oxidase with cupredoxin domain
MNRRRFLAQAAIAGAGCALVPGRNIFAETSADFRLDIAPFELEVAPGKRISTIAYNGRVPGPLIRWPEGKPVRIDVANRTDVPEIVHWHGMIIPSIEDGAAEEGSPMIAPGATRRYSFTPRPAGFRWYHTHAFAGRDLKRGLYSGQFGCFYVEPRSEPGAFDQTVFLTLHDWDGYMSASGDASMDVAYDCSTINGRMLGHGEPIRVREGQQLLLRIVNASATMTHWLALPAHTFTVLALDGNSVPVQASVQALRLAPAERADVLVTMNSPGVWILGETRGEIRKAGMGIVVEYAGQQGEAKWVEPTERLWDYRRFARPNAESIEPDVRIPLVFDSKFHGHGAFETFTINGKSFPHTDTVMLRAGKRYRLMMENKSTDDHPVHLHRHTFEVTSLNGQTLSGLRKDVVVVSAKGRAAVDFVADDPGLTLFHCHQQAHMDFGFMMLFDYA